MVKIQYGVSINALVNILCVVEDKIKKGIDSRYAGLGVLSRQEVLDKIVLDQMGNQESWRKIFDQTILNDMIHVMLGRKLLDTDGQGYYIHPDLLTMGVDEDETWNDTAWQRIKRWVRWS
jgi:hypothetical protein